VIEGPADRVVFFGQHPEHSPFLFRGLVLEMFLFCVRQLEGSTTMVFSGLTWAVVGGRPIQARRPR